ncbi:MAG: leucine-rich repeat domain-containing protein [Alphaproteobacteria bacterium]|nr:MAG: leucine-rich repeat domain-containing protein [Alphaproteobacteria bacterium]
MDCRGALALNGVPSWRNVICQIENRLMLTSEYQKQSMPVRSICGGMIRPSMLRCSSTFMLLAMCLFPVKASALVSGDYDYELINGGKSVVITYYQGEADTLSIPSMIANLPVTAIGDGAFSSGAVSFRSLSIPDSVVSIGKWSFAGCWNLENLVLPRNLVTIGESAFSSCSDLMEVKIPSTVKSIGDGAFSSCSALTRVIMSTGISSISSNLFQGCGSLASFVIPSGVVEIGESSFANSGLVSIAIPAGVSSIGDSAFHNCDALASLTIPASVTSLGYHAFGDCEVLTSVSIPGNVSIIPAFAFSYCPSLATVTLSEGIQRIDEHAFADCVSLTGITIPDSMTLVDGFDGCNGLISFTVGESNRIYSSLDGVLFNKARTELVRFPYGKPGSYVVPETVVEVRRFAFAGSWHLTNVSIPSSVQSIGDGAFSYCRSLVAISVDAENPIFTGVSGILFSKDVTTLLQFPAGIASDGYTVPVGVTTLGNYAFRGCWELHGINIPQTVTRIGANAFEQSGLFDVYLGDHVAEIGEGAFNYCDNLRSVRLPEGLEDIPGGIFSGCLSLSNVAIPAGVKTIGNWAFYYSGLTSVDLPSRVTSIGVGAFQLCLGITTLDIPDGVVNIQDQAFEECYGLTSVSIGNGVAKIGGRAFQSCNRLSDLSLGSGVSQIGKSAFASSGLVSLVIPDSVISIGDSGFSWCWKLTTVSFGSGLTSIGEEAFDSCEKLASLALPETVKHVGKRAFARCISLKRIVIPGGITRIEEATFRGCYRVGEITIGNSVTSVENSAFEDCEAIAKLTMGNRIRTIGKRAFHNCREVTSVVIPSSVVSIGDEAFGSRIYFDPFADDPPPDYGSLQRATFLGDAPTVGNDVFVNSDPAFRIYFTDGKRGFSWPQWKGYPTTPLGAQITVQQPVGSFLAGGTAKKSFGSVKLGKAGAWKVFTIRNIGTQNLVVSSLAIQGAHPKDFIATKPVVKALKPGKTTTFKVRFRPTVRGKRKAVIRLKSNDVNDRDFVISLAGAGVK